MGDARSGGGRESRWGPERRAIAPRVRVCEGVREKVVERVSEERARERERRERERGERGRERGRGGGGKREASNLVRC